ncbi:MAG: DUF4199 domain-containing protein [Saprospiraceae bacterium]|nr:DUF4199 domain-containing protein [Saprospiraceae bacterium]
MDFLQSNWVKYGMYLGIITILVQLVSYYVTPINVWMQMLLGFVIMIVLFYLAGKAEREANGGVLSYGQALKTTFLTGLTGTVISTLFSIILIQLIDPSLVEKLAEISVETARSMMEKFGMPEDQMAAALEKAEEEAANAFTPGKMLLQIVYGSIFVLIFAAIVSIFVKKNEDPNHVSVQDIGEV